MNQPKKTLDTQLNLFYRGSVFVLRALTRPGPLRTRVIPNPPCYTTRSFLRALGVVPSTGADKSVSPLSLWWLRATFVETTRQTILDPRCACGALDPLAFIFVLQFFREPPDKRAHAVKA